MTARDFMPDADWITIDSIRAGRAKWLERHSSEKYRKAIKAVSDIRARHVSFENDAVVIGDKSELPAADRERLLASLRTFMPWRKGPFDVFGTRIDAEWRSDKKWNRIIPVLPSLKGKVIADIGCNNGYYMFRMLAHEPAFVYGIDPTVHYYFTYRLLENLSGVKKLDYDLLGVEHLNLFPSTFDVIFLLGIIYHHPSPLEMIRTCVRALKPGGTLIIETQGIQGDLPVALFPEKRYAKAPGTYFVPTESCLLNLAKRGGLKNCHIFDRHPMNSSEQRSTDWMVFESYDDFLDPENPSLTIEGYPAPSRFYLCGNRIQ